eukprot:15174820-Alexandrium_andersonii.AAC.1
MADAEASQRGDSPTDLEAGDDLQPGDHTADQPQVEPLEALVEAPRELAEAGATVGFLGLAATAELDLAKYVDE